jgi:hypothetical protein
MRTISTAVAAVLIVALGLGGWWFRGRHLPLASAMDVPSSGTADRYPADPLALAELGGAKENNATIDDLADLRALNVLTNSELAVYEQAGTGRAKVGIANYPEGKATVILVRVSSPDAAKLAERQLNELQLSFGLQPNNVPQPAGVDSTKLTAKPDVLPGGRAHYTHGDVLVRVEVRGPDQRSAYGKFEEVLGGQLKALPPDE